MSKNRIVLSIGIFLFLMPFLGFPSRWEFFFQIIFGISLVAVSFSSAIKRRAASRRPRRRRDTPTVSPMDSSALQPTQPESSAEASQEENITHQ